MNGQPRSGTAKGQPARQQFDGLHGLRGAAAICVMLSHFSWFVSRQIFPQAHVAVDLFFMLSGFVISHAYDDRLARGMPLGVFARARARRLYPLYVLSIVIAIACVPLMKALGVVGFSHVDWAVSSVSGLLMLPTVPRFSSDGSLFPLNGPAWSLFWELAINALFAILAMQLGKKMLQLLIFLGAVAALGICLHFRTLEGGAYWREIPSGAVRVWFSFFAGVYLRRHHFRPDRARSGAWPFWIAVALSLAAMLIVPPSGTAWMFDLGTVFVIWPMVILMASRASLRGGVRRASHLAGEASYGIYVLHMPMIVLCGGLWAHFAGIGRTQLPIVAVPVIAASIVAIATAAHFLYDAPVRAWLSGRRNPVSTRDEVVQF